MSVISALLLFLLCIPFHACDARRLGATVKELEAKSLLPNKDDEEMSSLAPKFQGKEAVKRDTSAIKQSRAIDKDDHEQVNSLKAKKVEGQGVKASSVGVQISTESLVSHDVTWRLPRKKRGEKQPGFNLDYAPPKTHPPVHN